jgi:hypothetical protein
VIFGMQPGPDSNRRRNGSTLIPAFVSMDGARLPVRSSNAARRFYTDLLVAVVDGLGSL